MSNPNQPQNGHQRKSGHGEWFIIQSGEHEGRPHLVGWDLTAILANPTSPRDDGWFGLATCPRCGALVRSVEDPISGGMWQHEQWHANTDYPIPAELAEAVATRAERSRA